MAATVPTRLTRARADSRTPTRRVEATATRARADSRTPTRRVEASAATRAGTRTPMRRVEASAAIRLLIRMLAMVETRQMCRTPQTRKRNIITSRTDWKPQRLVASGTRLTSTLTRTTATSRRSPRRRAGSKSNVNQVPSTVRVESR